MKLTKLYVIYHDFWNVFLHSFITFRNQNSLAEFRKAGPDSLCSLEGLVGYREKKKAPLLNYDGASH